LSDHFEINHHRRIHRAITPIADAGVHVTNAVIIERPKFAAIVRRAPEPFQDFFSHIARLEAVSNNRRVYKEAVVSKPKVSYLDLELAFTASDFEYICLLDTQTGEVVSYESDIEDELLTGADISYRPKWQEGEVAAARRALRACGELLEPGEEADQVREPGRYIEIPRIKTDEAYRAMTDFAETVRNAHLRELLDVALRGKGAFRRFKDVLLNYPAERERWFEFESQRQRETIEAWAREQGMEISFEVRR